MLLVVITVALIVIGVLITYLSKIGKLIDSLRNQVTNLTTEKDQFIINQKDVIEKARKDALDKSRNVIRGQITEELLPMFKGFPYNGSDCKFFANPVDYIIFKNMSKVRDSGEGEIEEVVFVDVKTRGAKLNDVQKKIKEAILQGRVCWETLTVDENNSIIVERN